MFAVGHVGWGSRYDLNATVTAGIISKLVSHHAAPVLLQVVCSTDSCLVRGRAPSFPCFSPLSIHFPIFYPFFFSFSYLLYLFLILSIPSLST